MIAYFGRGYVQITWWENYAKASQYLGRGFDLLFDPEIVKEPLVAYRIMSEGMRMAAIFSKTRFENYFSGSNRDYIGARAMVNGTDHAVDIAKIAESFEAILLDARKK